MAKGHSTRASSPNINLHVRYNVWDNYNVGSFLDNGDENMHIRKISLIFIALLVLAQLVACSGFNIGGTPTPFFQASTPALEEDTVSASGEVVPQKWVSLGFPSGGQNVKILAVPGQYVYHNQFLASVDNLSAISARDSANAQLASAEANLQHLKDVKAPDLDITAAEASVSAAQSSLDLANQALQDTKIFSPFDGLIVEINGHEGEIVPPGQPVIVLADFSTLQVQTTDMSEVDATRVQFGDAAEVSFDAFPNISVSGKVSRIALKDSPGSGVYYTVTIDLDTIPDEFRWGMSAYVVITVK